MQLSKKDQGGLCISHLIVPIVRGARDRAGASWTRFPISRPSDHLSLTSSVSSFNLTLTPVYLTECFERVASHEAAA